MLKKAEVAMKCIDRQYVLRASCAWLDLPRDCFQDAWASLKDDRLAVVLITNSGDWLRWNERLECLIDAGFFI